MDNALYFPDDPITARAKLIANLGATPKASGFIDLPPGQAVPQVVVNMPATPQKPDASMSAKSSSSTTPTRKTKAEQVKVDPGTQAGPPQNVVDVPPQGPAPQRGEWSNAASQAMIAAGLALMKHAGGVYKTADEAGSLPALAAAGEAANSAYQGTKASEAAGTRQSINDAATNYEKRASGQAKLTDMTSFDQKLQLAAVNHDRVASNASMISANLGLSNMYGKELKDTETIARLSAANTLGAAGGITFVTNPITGEKEVDLSGVKDPSEVARFNALVKKNMLEAWDRRKAVIQNDYVHSSVRQAISNTQDAAPAKQNVLAPGSAAYKWALANGKSQVEVTGADGTKTMWAMPTQ
jgi:hypothetical protein